MTFSRRKRLSTEQCSSSRDYFDICLANGEDKETITPDGIWFDFRPEPDIVYSDGTYVYIYMPSRVLRFTGEFEVSALHDALKRKGVILEMAETADRQTD